MTQVLTESFQAREVVREIPLDHLVTGAFRLRPIDQRVVKELSRSISHLGLLQPIVVRPVALEKFEIIFGLHRTEACRKLGFRTIKSIVRDISVEDAFLASVAENLQRNTDIDAFEEAKGYQTLLNKGWTQTKIAERIGKSDSYVSDRLNLIRRLHPSIASRLEDNKRQFVLGSLTPSHAQRLARIKDPAKQIQLANLIEQANLSVHDLENVLMRKSARGRFFVKVRKNCTVAIPPQLAQRLTITEHDVVEVRIRHGKLTVAKVQGSDAIRF